MQKSVFESAKDYQDYMIPFEKITQLQMNTGERLAKSQTALMNSLWNQSLAFGGQIFSKKDPSEFFKSQQAFLDGVSQQVRDAAEQSLEVMTEANEKIVAIFQDSLAQNSAGMKVPDFKKAAKEITKATKSATKAAKESSKETAKAMTEANKFAEATVAKAVASKSSSSTAKPRKSTSASKTGTAKKTTKPAPAKTAAKKADAPKPAEPPVKAASPAAKPVEPAKPAAVEPKPSPAPSTNS